MLILDVYTLLQDLHMVSLCSTIMHMKPPKCVIVILNVGFEYTYFMRLPNHGITMYQNHAYEALTCVIVIINAHFGYKYFIRFPNQGLTMYSIMYMKPPNVLIMTLNGGLGYT